VVKEIVYKNILGNMRDGVMTIGTDGTIITFNNAAETILELKSGDVVNRVFGEVFLVAEENDKFNQTILNAVYESAMAHSARVHYKTAEKDLILNVTTSFLKSPEGKEGEKSAVIVVFQDITEVEQLRTTEARLTDELKSQHKELQAAYIDLEGANTNLHAALKKVHMIRIVATAFVIVLFVILGLISWKRIIPPGSKPATETRAEIKDPSRMKTFIVSEQRLTDAIALKGSLKPINVVNITSPFTGKVKEKLFQYGESVRKGQLLLKMDATETETKYGEADVAYIKALEKMREMDKWDNADEVTKARRSVTKSKMTLDTSKSKFEQSNILFKKGYISATDLESDKQQYETSRMDYDASLQELQTAINKGKGDNYRVTKIELDNARTKLHVLELQLQKANVVAPVSGTVILPDAGSDKDKKGKLIEVGMSFTEGDLLVSIGDTGGFSVTAEVDEMEVLKVKKGQEAIITGDAFSGITLKGTVSHVSSQASKSDASKKTPVYAIIVSVEKSPPEAREKLLLGMSCKVQITTMDRPNTIMIPIRAVSIEGQGNYVMIRDKKTNEIKKTKVETGITTLDSVEIVKGLTKGEEILLP
jgi:HlyD family secretion protein